MKLTIETVNHVAKLSALRLSEDEASRMKDEMENVLTLVGQLHELNTEGVEPMQHVHGVVNAFREDTVNNSLKTEQLAEIAPSYSNAGIRVPKVV